MRRSRAALTLFLVTLAVALQSAGFVHVQRGMATEPLDWRLCSAPGSILDCYAGAPDSFGDDWYLNTCRPSYECYGSHGADCFDGPRIHLEDISHLARDPRHSSGQDEVLRINRENEGLQAASLSTGDHPRDLPAGEALHVSRVALSRISSGFDYDDVYHGNAGYAYSDCYGAWDAEYADCELDEPSDLPPGETVLHVAKERTYSDDYEYEYGYIGDEDDYVYDAYGTPYAASAAAALPSFMAGTSVEPSDLPPGERFIGDLPPGEVLTDDLPPGEDIADDLPPGEDITDLPPAEVKDDLPPDELGGEDLAPYAVFAADLPPVEEISDLPPAENAWAATASHRGRAAEWDCDYDYGCHGDYTIESYGDYGDGDAGHNRTACHETQAWLRPLLRTASRLLNHIGEVLKGLSKSCDQMADAAAEKPVDDSVRSVPPEMDYPWPAIIGRHPQRDQSPGL